MPEESSKGRTRQTIRCCLTTVFVLLASVANLGQTQNQSTPVRGNEDEAEIGCVLQFSTRLVIVEVEVIDRSGDCVLNLSHNDFLVYEDRKKQEVEYCSEAEILETGIFPIKYTIGYYPPNEIRDGAFRSIRVKVRDAKARGMRVSYYPEWYFATPSQ
jgi:hypothetical protein